MDLLVFGGQGGVGRAVVKAATDLGYKVATAGIHPDEHHHVDLENGAQIVGLMGSHHWDHVVMASGLNLETQLSSMGLHRATRTMMAVNCLGPIVALQAWLKASAKGHFVVVSSNSAHIPRTSSLGYCASKAAVSMAVRVAAREVAKESGVAVWGVEPGWIDDTPMSQAMLRRLAVNNEGKKTGAPPAHRIPGGRTNAPRDIANFIMDGIDNDLLKFNGCMFRLDGGEI